MQLELFPTPMQQEPEISRVWQELEESLQTALVTKLARLIAKAMQREPEEDKDER
jgi:hypothetical protein